MKKAAFALVLVGSILAASAPTAAVSATACTKNGWLYSVSGTSMTGWDMITYVNDATGGSYNLQGATNWLSQHGYTVTVVARDCSPQVFSPG